ncbi:sulfotransferase family protein [Sphaerisporangium corydalis]|uniref:Sulfotransferase family protein n=1 Tax=Sphaerisporangium corydalis TaxID=1441875 RepID=A0ABV9EB44_9ACTN|nr:sulfotransferase family protein [Sphaerisporangium corydalis]
MLQIVGAGFGRTGTLSLRAALDKIGFAPCYHFTELLTHPDHLSGWLSAAHGAAGAWRGPLSGYEATTDWPCVAFWRELVEDNPEAKVILTSRDADAWYESMIRTIFKVMGDGAPGHGVTGRFGGLPDGRRLAEFAREIVVDHTFGGHIDDRAHVISCYERHNDEVRRTVAPDRLLDYHVDQGWEPLCAFLGVPVPPDPFPHLNDRAAFPPNLPTR